MCSSRIQGNEGVYPSYWQEEPTATQKDSLLFCGWSIYSQFGEEGVLDEILKRLNLSEGVFIEFSVFYDLYVSNTRFLADRGWQGVFIDVSTDLSTKDRIKSQNLRKLSPILCMEEILYFKDIGHLPQVQFIKWFITRNSIAARVKNFDQVAHTFFPNKEIDVLSIDLDGLDYLILEELQHKPKVIVVKGASYWTPHVSARRIPDVVTLQGLDQSLPVIIDIAKKQGYMAVCYTGYVFLIREDLSLPFEKIKNDPVNLWFDSYHYYAEKNHSQIS